MAAAFISGRHHGELNVLGLQLEPEDEADESDLEDGGDDEDSLGSLD